MLVEDLNLITIQNNLLSVPSPEINMWFPIPREGEVNYESRIDISNIQITEKYVETLDEYLLKALTDFTGYSKLRPDGFLVALSGGIDSSVVARLLQLFAQKNATEFKAIIIGQGSPDTEVKQYLGTPAEWLDIQFARQLCHDLQIPYDYIDVSEEVGAARSHYKTSWAVSSQLPRIRANHLYSNAEEFDLIPVGSINGSEYILAAFSTGGPAGNIAPLADLYKSEVYALARDIGVPDYIQKRKPLISELNIADCELYGGERIDSTIIDPIIRRLWYQKQNPQEVSDNLCHSVRWINEIFQKRIKGEEARRGYSPFVINRPLKAKTYKPNLVIDRSYFP